MKHLVLAVALGLLLFSCKKETAMDINITSQKQNEYLLTVQAKLKDSLSSPDYAVIDFSKAFKSYDTGTHKTYLRLGFTGKTFSSDFIILQTDSAGDILKGKTIHIDKTTALNEKNKVFNGTVIISSLNDTVLANKNIIGGRVQNNKQSLKADPDGAAGEQTLAPVVVTAYAYNGMSMDWYLLSGFFDEGGSWMYSASSPGDGSGGGGGIQSDETMVVEQEMMNDPMVRVEQYIKCFGDLPAIGAQYEISILTDIPVNGDPSKMFDWSTGSPGHSFIQLKETKGGQSIQQNIGFYPTTGWKTIGGPITSITEDNAGHEFNAELTITVNSKQFQNALDMMQQASQQAYDLASFNCTDFALSVFNAANPEPLSIPQYTAPGYSESSNTPQGLYNKIKLIQQTANTTFGEPLVPGVCGFVGESHGPCN